MKQTHGQEGEEEMALVSFEYIWEQRVTHLGKGVHSAFLRDEDRRVKW